MVRLSAKHRNYLVHLASRSLTRAKLSAKEEWREILREPRTGPLDPGPRKDDSMFRRLVSAWVMVGTILVGGSAKAQRPFPVNLVPEAVVALTDSGSSASGSASFRSSKPSGC